MKEQQAQLEQKIEEVKQSEQKHVNEKKDLEKQQKELKAQGDSKKAKSFYENRIKKLTNDCKDL